MHSNAAISEAAEHTEHVPCSYADPASGSRDPAQRIEQTTQLWDQHARVLSAERLLAHNITSMTTSAVSATPSSEADDGIPETDLQAD